MVKHYPVMLEEATDILVESGGEVYVDCTVGGGGHARRVLEKLPNAFVIGIDRDEEALKRAQENLEEFEGRYSLYRANFSHLDEVLSQEGLRSVDGFLFDLGVSMYQIKGDRGFSFLEDTSLDMRMDTSSSLRADKVVNEYPLERLVKIFKEYGEERFAGRIAKAIDRYRRKKRIESSRELAQVVWDAVPPKYRHGRIHPATRVFQAIRIEVNDELGSLQAALGKALSHLKAGGRLVVISFHSLEDRIVKRFMKENAHRLKVLTKKPLQPSEREVALNPPSRSAKLRAGERLP